jgi:hypothetical protein
MDMKNERGEKILPPSEYVVLKKFVVFAPDGLPMLQTIASTKVTAKELAVESMQHGFSESWPDWNKLQKWGANVQSVTVTIQISK